MQLLIQPIMTLLSIDATEATSPGVHETRTLENDVVHTPAVRRQAHVELKRVLVLLPRLLQGDTHLGHVAIDLGGEDLQSMATRIANPLHITMLQEALQGALPCAPSLGIQLTPEGPEDLLGEILDVKVTAGDLGRVLRSNRLSSRTWERGHLGATEPLKDPLQ